MSIITILWCNIRGGYLVFGSLVGVQITMYCYASRSSSVSMACGWPILLLTLLHYTNYHQYSCCTHVFHVCAILVQLVDFGLGVTFSDDSDVFREDVGSLYYVAPEVLARNYTKVSFGFWFQGMACLFRADSRVGSNLAGRVRLGRVRMTRPDPT